MATALCQAQGLVQKGKSTEGVDVAKRTLMLHERPLDQIILILPQLRTLWHSCISK